MRSSPRLRKWAIVAAAGASPSGPFRCGSTTCRVNPAATAASNALPPFSSTPIATEDASQWVVATTPNVPRISGRVVKPGMRAFLSRELCRLRLSEPEENGQDSVYRLQRHVVCVSDHGADAVAARSL